MVLQKQQPETISYNTTKLWTLNHEINYASLNLLENDVDNSKNERALQLYCKFTVDHQS